VQLHQDVTVGVRCKGVALLGLGAVRPSAHARQPGVVNDAIEEIPHEGVAEKRQPLASEHAAQLLKAGSAQPAGIRAPDGGISSPVVASGLCLFPVPRASVARRAGPSGLGLVVVAARRRCSSSPFLGSASACAQLLRDRGCCCRWSAGSRCRRPLRPERIALGRGQRVWVRGIPHTWPCSWRYGGG
jgi:hypothetical protein